MPVALPLRAYRSFIHNNYTNNLWNFSSIFNCIVLVGYKRKAK